MKTLRKPLSVLLSVLMALSVFSGLTISVSAADPIDWTTSNSLPADPGSYVLQTDVNIGSNTWTPADGTILDLNGHKLTSSGTAISVENGVTFTIVDSKKDSTDPADKHYYTGNNPASLSNTETDDYFIGGYITGTTGSSSKGKITVQSGGNCIMNGGTVFGNRFTSDGGGVFVCGNNEDEGLPGGVFTLNGGNIIGNRASWGGGAYLQGGSTFNLISGSVSSNYAPNGGGGILTWGTFNMSGGLVSKNGSIGPAGFYLFTGEFHLSGGTITGNTSSRDQGGLGGAAKAYISGNPVVSGNKSRGSASDFYIPNEKTLTLEGELTEGASIGIQLQTAPSEDNPTTFVDGWGDFMDGAAPSDYFFSNQGATFALTGSGELVAASNLSYDIPTGLTAIYGQTLADVTLTNGWSWNDATTPVGNAGMNSFPASLAVDGLTVIENLSVNVAKADPVLVLPAGMTAICGDTLAVVALSNPDENIPGTWTWNDDTTAVEVVGNDHENATKDSTYPATFTPEDTDNYNDAVRNLTVTVAHDYVDHEYQDSTCIYIGWEEYQTCAGCDYTTYVEIPKKTEHTPGMPLVTTTFAPTCTQRGYTLYACACGWTEEGDFLDPLTHAYDDGVYQAPTCTTPGGMLYTCTREGCTDAEAGHTKFEEYEDEPALGHDMGAFHISAHPTIPGVYCMKSDCAREDCHYFEYELDENDNVNVYYKVNFYTNYALPEGAYYTAGDGAQLADTSAYYTKKIGETYVISGGSIAFEDTPIAEAYRAPTAECGWYKVSGWTVSLDNVASNLNAYAEYEAKDKYYEVKFVTPDDPIMPFFTTGPSVLHGHAATGPSLEPTKASDKTYNYNFIGWDKDFSKVYSNMVVTAQFEAVKRVYKLVYHDKDGAAIGSELFNNGDPALTYPTNLEAYADDYYSYVFTGKWHYENGASVKLSELTVPSWCVNEYDAGLEGDESVPNAMKGILDIYPTYEKTPITYPVTINVASTNGDILNGAVVKVFNEGGIVAASKTISGTTSVSFSLMKGTYTVAVTYDNETLTDSFTTSTEGSTLNFAFEIRDYEEVETECGCLCHIPLIGRIYIMFHNIIFTLTGKKTVCCDDMMSGQYANKLKYTV